MGVRRYTREDVQTHRSGYFGPSYPSVNVKFYGRGVGTEDVVRKFGCSEKRAEKALEYAWTCACEDFWENDAPEIVNDVFGRYVKFYQEGRSGGWLNVEGLPDIEEWDAITLARWRSFERRIKRAVEWYNGEEYVLDLIEANGWCEPEEQDEREVSARYAESLEELKG